MSCICLGQVKTDTALLVLGSPGKKQQYSCSWHWAEATGSPAKTNDMPFAKLTQSSLSSISILLFLLLFSLSPPSFSCLHRLNSSAGANFHISFSRTLRAAVSLTRLPRYGRFLLVCGHGEFELNNRKNAGTQVTKVRSCKVVTSHDDFCCWGNE